MSENEVRSLTERIKALPPDVKKLVLTYLDILIELDNRTKEAKANDQK